MFMTKIKAPIIKRKFDLVKLRTLFLEDSMN